MGNKPSSNLGGGVGTASYSSSGGLTMTSAGGNNGGGIGGVGRYNRLGGGLLGKSASSSCNSNNGNIGYHPPEVGEGGIVNSSNIKQPSANSADSRATTFGGMSTPGVTDSVLGDSTRDGGGGSPFIMTVNGVSYNDSRQATGKTLSTGSILGGGSGGSGGVGAGGERAMSTISDSLPPIERANTKAPSTSSQRSSISGSPPGGGLGSGGGGNAFHEVQSPAMEADPFASNNNNNNASNQNNSHHHQQQQQQSNTISPGGTTTAHFLPSLHREQHHHSSVLLNIDSSSNTTTASSALGLNHPPSYHSSPAGLGSSAAGSGGSTPAGLPLGNRRGAPPTSLSGNSLGSTPPSVSAGTSTDGTPVPSPLRSSGAKVGVAQKKASINGQRRRDPPKPRWSAEEIVKSGKPAPASAPAHLGVGSDMHTSSSTGVTPHSTPSTTATTSGSPQFSGAPPLSSEGHPFTLPSSSGSASSGQQSTISKNPGAGGEAVVEGGAVAGGGNSNSSTSSQLKGVPVWRQGAHSHLMSTGSYFVLHTDPKRQFPIQNILLFAADSPSTLFALAQINKTVHDVVLANPTTWELVACELQMWRPGGLVGIVWRHTHNNNESVGGNSGMDREDSAQTVEASSPTSLVATQPPPTTGSCDCFKVVWDKAAGERWVKDQEEEREREKKALFVGIGRAESRLSPIPEGEKGDRPLTPPPPNGFHNTVLCHPDTADFSRLRSGSSTSSSRQSSETGFAFGEDGAQQQQQHRKRKANDILLPFPPRVEPFTALMTLPLISARKVFQQLCLCTSASIDDGLLMKVAESNAAPLITYLDLCRTHVSAEGVKSLMEKCTNISELKIHGCEGISPVTLRMLQKEYPLVRTESFSPDSHPPSHYRIGNPISVASRPVSQRPVLQWGNFRGSPIIDNLLYLGDAADSRALPELRALGVRRILDVAKECPPSEEVLAAPDVGVLFLQLKDHSDEDILGHMSEGIKYIREGVEKKEPVLVHCRHGVSRSATFVIAYLIRFGLSPDPSRETLLTYEEAFNHCKSRRPQISPNLGFVLALHTFDAKLHGTDSTIFNFDANKAPLTDSWTDAEQY